MTKEEIIDRWLAYELYLFILPYLFLYGESYIKDPNNSKWLRWQFEREWNRKSGEEKQKRFESFYQQLQESEVLNDERND